MTDSQSGCGWVGGWTTRELHRGRPIIYENTEFRNRCGTPIPAKSGVARLSLAGLLVKRPTGRMITQFSPTSFVFLHLFPSLSLEVAPRRDLQRDIRHTAQLGPVLSDIPPPRCHVGRKPALKASSQLEPIR